MSGSKSKLKWGNWRQGKLVRIHAITISSLPVRGIKGHHKVWTLHAFPGFPNTPTPTTAPTSTTRKKRKPTPPHDHKDFGRLTYGGSRTRSESRICHGRAQAGEEVVIDRNAVPVAVLRATKPRGRRLSDIMAALPENSTATLDADFATDVQSLFDNHRDPLNRPIGISQASDPDRLHRHGRRSARWSDTFIQSSGSRHKDCRMLCRSIDRRNSVETEPTSLLGPAAQALRLSVSSSVHPRLNPSLI